MPKRTSILVIGAGLHLHGPAGASIKYHSKASPGPQDSVYLFGGFVEQLNC